MNRPSTQKIRLLPAVSLVVASMVGTGVFTSLGFQLRDLPSGPVIVLAWSLGGLLALCGALCYAELAGSLPRSGGEYHFISELYHPSLGWTAGVISAVAGFAAPLALAAMACGRYAHRAVDGLAPMETSIAVILVVSAGHLINLHSSARLQVVSTALKLGMIVVSIGIAFALPGKGDIRWTVDATRDFDLVWQPGFAIALLFVFYAYSGWNGVVYLIDEIEDPRRTVGLALVIGTLVVLALYVLLNVAFLRAAPVGELTGVIEVGHVAAQSLLGAVAARGFSGLLALGLVATVSALVWSGPRVLVVMGRDFPLLRMFARRNIQGIPVVSTLALSGLALVFVVTGSFERLLAYTQFALTLYGFLTVFGIFIQRRRKLPDSSQFRCPWYPLPPLVFLGMTGFVMIRSLIAEPESSGAGLLTIGVAWLLYFPIRSRSRL
jgi:APA family basic amino acid/polyamine antiporter